MKGMWVILGLTAVLLLTITGCGSFNVGPTQTDTQSIELGDADSAEVTVKMGVGELAVRGGAANLMDAEFTYNIEEWRPEVSYDIRQGEGQLDIVQPENVTSINGIPDGNINYKWDLAFANDVPMTLAVDLGAGKSDLVLGDLHLTNLDVNVGVGETNLDLTGNWREDASIAVKGGVGSTTMKLPNNVGVRVTTETGLGSVDVYGLIRNGDVYTNEQYGQSDVQLDITVSGGVGAIRIDAEQ